MYDSSPSNEASSRIEKLSYEKDTITIDQAKKMLPSGLVFFESDGDELDHRDKRDEEFDLATKEMLADRGLSVTTNEARMLLQKPGNEVRAVTGMTRQELELALYKKLLEKNPNLVWLRGGEFSENSKLGGELHGSVGECSLPISYVASAHGGIKRKHPTLGLIFLKDIVKAHEDGIITFGRENMNIHWEMIPQPESELDKTKFNTWLREKSMVIRIDTNDPDPSSKLESLFASKAV